MRRLRALSPSIALFLLTAPVLSESIPNWTAPASWRSPRAAALEKKIRESRTTETLATEAVPTGPLPFFGITPCRIADTRGNGFAGQYGPPQITGAGRTITIAGQCGIPLGAQAVSFNFHVANISAAGFFVAYPAGEAFPPVALMAYNQNTPVVSNSAVVPLGAGGAITVVAGVTNVDLIIDTNGYYAPASTAGSKTVAVDCTMGQKIQAAIDREDGPLVIDVNGICNENVSVKRKDVTLRGSDPVSDGIQGVVSVPQFAALRFAYVDFGVVENLSISNGPSSGLAAFYSRIQMVNCRLNGNATQGITLSHSSLGATGLTVSQNQGRGANVGTGSFFMCAECDFQGNLGFAAAAVSGGFLTLHDSVVTGIQGLLASGPGASFADIDCLSTTSSHSCTLQTTGRAVRALGGARAGLFGGGDFTGQLTAENHGIVEVLGARQLATGQPGQGPTANSVADFGRLTVAGESGLPSQLLGTTNVSGFGRALLRDGTTLAGSIQCDSAGDAWLDPTVVAAPGSSVTGCEHGALPPP